MTYAEKVGIAALRETNRAEGHRAAAIAKREEITQLRQKHATQPGDPARQFIENETRRLNAEAGQHEFEAAIADVQADLFKPTCSSKAICPGGRISTAITHSQRNTATTNRRTAT